MKRLVGITGSSFYQGANALIGRLRPGNQLLLKRYPDNPVDKNAIAVHWGAKIIGHLPRGVAKEFAPLIDAGLEVHCRKGNGPWGVLEIEWDENHDAITRNATASV